MICPEGLGIQPGSYILKDSGLFFDTKKSVFLGEKCLTDSAHDWLTTIFLACAGYSQMLADDVKPEDARFLLPNAMKTEVCTTFNIRQWRHVFNHRALNPRAQWEIRKIMLGILNDFSAWLPVLFGDLKE